MDEEFLVPVVVGSSYEPGKVPTEIVVDFNYYQVTKSVKKLVTAGVSFSGFISPEDYPNSPTFNYTLSFRY